MTTANNAIYTPSPTTIDVTVYRDDEGNIRADSGPAYLVATLGTVLGGEAATVVERGNLLRSGTERWYQVRLAAGSRHMVVGDGS